MTNEWGIKTFEQMQPAQFDALLELTRLLNVAHYPETLAADALDVAIRTLDAERGLFARC